MNHHNSFSKMKIQREKKKLDAWEKTRGAWPDGAKLVF